ncbi:MAG: TIGR03067 domain-containing protein [Planctomycetota bacterium]
MRVPIFAVIGLLFVSVVIAEGDATKKDLVKLQGTWSLVSGQRDGKKVSEEEAKNTVITISGSDFVFPNLSKIGTSAKGAVKLDPTKNPKWIDSTSSTDGVKSLGIYEFVGNGYRVCFAESGKDRPKDFSAKSGSGHNLQVWADSVEGTYVLVSGELKGQALAKEIVQAGSLLIEGNKHKAIAGSDPVIGTHKLSPSKKPKEIDSQDTEGPNNGITLGIYKYENGEFTVCFAAPGKDRPKEFTTKSGTGEFMHVWRRADADAIQGVYTMLSGEVKGEKLSEQTVTTAQTTVEGNRHTVNVGDDTIIGTHKLNPSKTPKEIESTDTEGAFKGKTYLGIYKLENGVWTVCFAAPGKDRPKEFTTKSGTGELMHVWKKK